MSKLCLTFVCVLLITCGAADLSRADDWPDWRGPTRDGVWHETGIIDTLPTPEIPVKWRVPISSGYSGPTVAKGRVYVMDRLTSPSQQERIHCFAESDGKTVWSLVYDCHYGKIGYQAGPRACVVIDEDRALALGAMGHIHCLNAATGDVIWKRNLNEDYKIQMPIWGIAASPLIVGDLAILHIGGSDGACIVALDKRTGAEKWRALDERAQYSTPVLLDQGGQRVVACWTGDSVAGLDPATGKVFWHYPWKPKNMPIGIASPIRHGDQLFLTSFYDGSLLLKLGATSPTAEKVWQRVGANEQAGTDALHSIISTPVFLGEHIYGVDSYGQLRCLDAKTGDRLWEDLTATPKVRWGTIHFVRNGDNIWMFNEQGELLISRLSPKGLEVRSRSQLISPTTDQLPRKNGVCWSHPAYANRHVFARNDKELVCASLSAK